MMSKWVCLHPCVVLYMRIFADPIAGTVYSISGYVTAVIWRTVY